MAKVSFYRGAALDVERFAMLGSFDRHRNYYPKTQIMTFDSRTEGWETIAVREWFGSNIARYQTEAGAPAGLAALSELGDIFISGPPEQDERVATTPITPMNGLRQIGGDLYAAGGGGCHFQRVPEGQWNPLWPDAYDPAFLSLGPVERIMHVMGFETKDEYRAMTLEEEIHAADLNYERTVTMYAVEGPRVDDIYLAGQNGALMHFDGTGLHRIESDEKSSFTEIHLHRGAVYIAGAHRGAVILKGSREAGFEPIFRAPVRELWLGSMAFLGDDIYISDPNNGTGGLYLLRGGHLSKVPGFAGPVWKVEAIDGILWAMEPKAVSRLDGDTWSRFESPFA